MDIFGYIILGGLNGALISYCGGGIIESILGGVLIGSIITFGRAIQ